MTYLTVLKTTGAALALAVSLIAFAAQRASADDDRCFFNGTMYSDGGIACQSAKQFECDDGEWESLDQACGMGAVVVSKRCEYDGISFSTGSASCQAGTQYRCEDGTWRSLAAPCVAGDAPIRPRPGGTTCMFDGATVASSSTICRSGTTFLCADGEWISLGTMCR